MNLPIDKNAVIDAEPALLYHHKQGRPFADVIAPLAEIALESGSLVLGYAGAAFRSRERLIPYFHVLSGFAKAATLRVFLLNTGADRNQITALGLSRLVLAMNARVALLKGIELTVFPRIGELDAELSPDILSEEDFASAGPDASTVGAVAKEFRRLDPDVLISVGQTSKGEPFRLSGRVNSAALRKALSSDLPPVAEGPLEVAVTDKAEPGSRLSLHLEVPECEEVDGSSKQIRNLLLLLLHILRDARKNGEI
jgi:hypothetical protein